MSTSKATIDFILDQLAPLGGATARKMFGEYALYYDGRVVGLVCDDTLFIKITEAGKIFVNKDYKEGFAYPGAKVSMEIDGDLMENREWICELVRLTAENLPLPKPKNTKIKKILKKIDK